MMRYDITTNDWVIFAPARARRPHELRQARAPVADSTGRCPFCPGNEDLTPGEIFAVRDDSGWSVRVVPNRFPALRIEVDPHRHYQGRLFGSMGACGAHEVIIESPDHERVLADQPVEHIERLLRALQFRHVDLMRDPRFQTITIFKNHGVAAGTSLRHPHWQLIATPVVPHTLRLKYAIAAQYFDQFGSCLYCDLLNEELAVRDRVVDENDSFAAVVPFASRTPFEIWISPKSMFTSFTRLDGAQLQPLAELLRRVLRRLRSALEDPDFNITVDSAARGTDDEEFFLFHLRIVPRLTMPAGFELGSNMWINIVVPEEAAAYLRDARP